MLDKKSVEYFLSELFDIYNLNGAAPREKILAFRPVFKEFLRRLTKDEKQYFSSQFSRTVYILDKYKVPEELARNIKKLRYFSVKLIRNKKQKCSEANFNYSFRVFFNAVSFFSYENEMLQSETAANIKSILEKLQFEDIEEFKTYKKRNKIDKISLVVKDRNNQVNTEKAGRKYSEILCENEELGIVKIRLGGIWKDSWKLMYKGANINLFDAESVFASDKSVEYITTGLHSILVLEPDYLIDVTDIAECFQSSGENINLYFLKKFLKSSISLPMAIGNIVNTCFDELINSGNPDFEDVYQTALALKPLQLFALTKKDPEQVRLMKIRAEHHFNNLKYVLPDISEGKHSVEPTFLSPDYGLQGRLDLMTEYEDDPNKKDIVELKSGKPPSTSLYMDTAEGAKVTVGIWPNNFAQITCYNMLLDSAFDNRTGSSQILYSGAIAGSSNNDYPLRNAPNIISKKQEVLNARNKIVAHERALGLGYFHIFNQIQPDRFGERPPFIESELNDFALKYNQATDIERDYLHAMTGLIQREILAGKIGSAEANRGNGFSSLWKDSLEDKEKALCVLSGLELDEENSDFNNFHLVFRSRNESIMLSSLRKGDMAILYPVFAEGDYNPLKQQIVKCSIKEIRGHEVKISVRNKLLRGEYLNNADYWVLEPDYLETTNKKLFASVFSIFKASTHKRNILLGLNEPEFEEIPEINIPELSTNQNCLLAKAVSAKDYFLLQGPPGTGKTSYMLRHISDYIFNHSDGNILIMAYTNRAVDEICSALKRIEGSFDFLRLGNKESSEHPDKLISQMVCDMPLRDVYIKVRECRVFVSTVSSVIANPEIMDIKHFQTVIIDEASQILEPHLIGILSAVERFIMIGDEKQLPSIVIQNSAHLEVNESSPGYESLKQINLLNLSSSLFERLLRSCVNNEWNNSYGLLNRQARMHRDIQEFPNKMFYNGSLEIFEAADWQVEESNLFNKESDNPYERLMAGSRLVFINSEIEKNSKLHKKEAEAVVEIVKLIKEKYADDFNEETVGVISPFRAQCAEIRLKLPEELRNMVRVDTVERFQGSERDIIIMSFAINHSYHMENLQSLVEINGTMIDRKLNVALTRARMHLVILGNAVLLSQSDIYKKLIEHIGGLVV